ncbi:mitochondrial small ribosomal subunit Rsm22-domain-containing protein [Aspergillus nidulans var. acristatus]
MLSRSPALRATRTKPKNIIIPGYSSLHAGSRQLRCRAPTLTNPRFSTKSTANAANSLKSIRRSGRTPNTYKSGQFVTGQRYSSSAKEAESKAEPDDAIYALIDKINTTEAEILELLDELDLTDEYSGSGSSTHEVLDDALNEAADHVEEQTAEERVHQARQTFGDTLPDGYLNEEETLLYSRLYGEPINRSEQENEVDEKQDEADRLFRDDGVGGWEEVPYDATETQNDWPVVYDMEAPPIEETAAMQRTREVAEQLGAEIMLETLEEQEAEGSSPRLHPLTRQGKFATDPYTVFPPKDTVTGPISAILSEFSNKHIADAAHKAFGGKLLPQSTRTAPAHAQEPQEAIGLSASQRFMSEMEANAYMAVLYPGMYASILSVLTEVRKRLGSDWLRSLISQEGGPNVLDAGAGGAAILAWRDVLRAEYELMVPDHPKSDPYPLGRSTVLTGSEPLRLRASLMLENTTFLPRLPDYIHTRDSPTVYDNRPPKRKQFDLVIAPYALMNFSEEYERKEYVENLWQLLKPNGGVLVLLEKGHQKGFEAIAGAREMLLKRYISSPGSTEYDALTESAGDDKKVQKEPGMIVAPCTNHERCPMYHTDGHAKGRKDFCHFEQRYIRPTFHQRIIGAKDRNHEDLKFSYVVVQRGIDLRQTEQIVQGPQATDAAFEGYEHLNEAGEVAEAEEVARTEVETPEPLSPAPETKFHALSLPRVLYPPMKRRGHVIFDMCTPAGKIERWTVPRSFSRRAFKDARKARWGDLWALGAKTRIPRNLKLGDKRGEGKKERLARRAAERSEFQEGEENLDDLDEYVEGRPSHSRLNIASLTREKGEKIPSWKKHAENKRLRHASRKIARESL